MYAVTGTKSAEAGTTSGSGGSGTVGAMAEFDGPEAVSSFADCTSDGGVTGVFAGGAAQPAVSKAAANTSMQRYFTALPPFCQNSIHSGEVQGWEILYFFQKVIDLTFDLCYTYFYL